MEGFSGGNADQELGGGERCGLVSVGAFSGVACELTIQPQYIFNECYVLDFLHLPLWIRKLHGESRCHDDCGIYCGHFDTNIEHICCSCSQSSMISRMLTKL